MSVPKYQHAAFLFFVFLLLCFSGRLRAQQVNFSAIGTATGLKKARITTLLQDRRGYLWIGTTKGLTRYDGNSYEHYTTRNGLPNEHIIAVAEDSKGNILLANDGGVDVYDGAAFSNLYKSSRVSAISTSLSGDVWCLADSFVVNITKGKPAKRLSLPDTGVLPTAITAIGQRLLVACSNGFIYTYNTTEQKWSVRVIELISNQPVAVREIYKGSRGHVWFVTNAGLFVKKGDSAIRYRLRRGDGAEEQTNMLCITEDALQNYWVGTEHGSIRFNDSGVRYFNSVNGFTDNPVAAVLTDAEGSIWLGTMGSGLYRFTGSVFSMYNKSSGLLSDQINAIAASRGGMLYLGSGDAGLFQYENGVSGALIFPMGIKPAITSIAVKGGYQLWIGTRGNGLWRYDYRGFKSYIAPVRGLPSNSVTVTYVDKKGRVWLGFDQGLRYIEKDTFRSTNINAAIYAVCQLSEDSVLFATASGIMGFSDSSFYQYQLLGIDQSIAPRCITAYGGKLYIGTNGDGVLEYDMSGKTGTWISKQDGLLSEYVVSLAKDAEGIIWIGTDAGLHSLNFDKNGRPVVRAYGEKQGATTASCNPNAVYAAGDGSLWFGTEGGIVRYKAQAKLNEPQAVNIFLQKLLLSGKTVNDTTRYSAYDKWQQVPYYLHLPAGETQLSFQFLAISLSAAEDMKYRYQLAGVDKGWSSWSKEQTITYSALPSGSFTLRVQATIDGQGIKELQYPFEIATPYYETMWFRVAVLALLVLIGVFLHFLYGRRLEMLRREAMEKKHQAQQAVRERTSNDFHRITAEKIREIYNAANSLQGQGEGKEGMLVHKIKDDADELYDNTKDMIWLMKEGNTNLERIVAHIGETGEKILGNSNISFEMESADKRLSDLFLPLDVALNLLMVFKEVYANVAEHSGATAARLLVTLRNRKVLQLKLNDNGSSFDIHYVRRGKGFKEMEQRAAAINARLYIDAVPDQGTIITLTFRVPSEE